MVGFTRTRSVPQETTNTEEALASEMRMVKTPTTSMRFRCGLK